MPVRSIVTTIDDAVITVVAEYPAEPARVWELFADPRLLERWWGPPTHPATVDAHDLTPGGVVRYHMSGPDGGRYAGWWRISEVDPGRRLVLEDGFGEGPEQAPEELPVSTMTVLLEPTGGGTHLTLEGRYATPEELQKVVAMGVEEGLAQAMGQIDPLLTERG
jgi:uncharacterized protein YndB with AHSA1/START domain